jgi:transcriptional antiterminator RfaH
MAERSLQRLGVEVFQPLVRVTPPAGASRRPVLRPLFGGYLFARFAANEFLEMVRFAPGVSYVVSSGRIPLPVEPEVIDAVRSRLDEDGYFRLQPAHFTPGQRVLIDQGPFAGMVGEVEREWDNGRRVAILLEAIHRARVLVERDAVVAR